MAVKVKARRPAGKNFFVLDVTDPVTGGRTTKSLGTNDEQLATSIAHDYTRLLTRPDLVANPHQCTLDLAGFNDSLNWSSAPTIPH